MRDQIASHVWTTPRGIPVFMYYRLDTSDWNTISSVMSPHDEYGLKDLYLTGTALDIGAHIGVVAIALAADNPDLTVIAVEPVPPNVMLIQKNAEANGYAKRIRVVHGAAGKSGQRVVRYGFTGSETAEHHAYIGDCRLPVPEGQYISLTVPSYSLSDLTDEEISFCKIDCEGGEFDFLDTDISGIDRIHGEWHPIPPFGHGGRQIVADLLDETHSTVFSGPIEGPGGFIALHK